MEKKFFETTQPLGGDGGKLVAAGGVDQNDLVLDAQVRYPFEKIAAPALQVVDSIIDKVEQWIPGDQKAMAEQFKADARKQLLELVKKA